MEKNDRNKGLFFGLGLIIVGVVIMLAKLNYQPDIVHVYLYRWESLLILIGLLSIIVRGKIFSGFIVLGMGSYFLLDDLLLLPNNWEIWFFPTLLILGGLAFIFAPDSPCCNRKKINS